MDPLNQWNNWMLQSLWSQGLNKWDKVPLPPFFHWKTAREGATPLKNRLKPATKTIWCNQGGLYPTLGLSYLSRKRLMKVLQAVMGSRCFLILLGTSLTKPRCFCLLNQGLKVRALWPFLKRAPLRCYYRKVLALLVCFGFALLGLPVTDIG